MARPQAAHRPPRQDYVEVVQAIALARPDLVGMDVVRDKPLALPFEVQCDFVEAPTGPMAAMARMLDAEQAEIVAN